MKISVISIVENAATTYIVAIIGIAGEILWSYFSKNKNFIEQISSVSFWIIIILILIIIIGQRIILRQKDKEIKQKIEEVRQIINTQNDYYKLLVEHMASAISTNNFDLSALLKFCVSKMIEELPQSGKNHKISIVKPLVNKKFKVLYSHGLNMVDIKTIEKDWTWDDNDTNKCFFAEGLMNIQKNEEPYHKYCKNDRLGKHLSNTNTSASSHFIIVMKDNQSYGEFPHKCIGEISIGIPTEYDFADDKNHEFYNSIYRYVKSIELILLFEYYLTKRKEECCDELLIRNNNNLEDLLNAMQSIAFSGETPNNIRNMLEPFIDSILNNLGGNNKYKITIVQPMLDGKYKILAQRGMSEKSCKSVEQKANWQLQEGGSFYNKAFNLDFEKPYCKVPSKDRSGISIDREENAISSTSHFIIGIKDKEYDQNKYPGNCIAIVSIGIPKEYDFDNNEEKMKKFYDTIFSSLKSKEIVLLVEREITKKTL